MKKNGFFILVFILSLQTFVHSAVRDGRAFWITRWEYTPGTSVNVHKQVIHDAMRDARDANMNMVVFQIRGNADAFYQSNYEPWSKELTGTLGQDPGWDPLQYAIEKAHQYNIELHAWLNTFPIWRATEPLPPVGTVSPEPVINAHPEWIVCDWGGNPMNPGSGYIGASPGIPAVRQHVINVTMDIVNNYEVDGIHFDYIRYPESSNSLGYSHDSISVALFNSPEGNPNNLSWEDWQRENINIFVRDVYDSISAVKPWVKMSAAVLGKYDYSGWNGYNIVFQDAKRWAQDGKIDIIFPMAYMTMAGGFDFAIYNWLYNLSADRHVIAGIGAYNIPWSEVLIEIDYCRNHQTSGECFFSYGSIESHVTDLRDGKFKRPSVVPNLPWKNAIIPQKPTGLTVFVESQNPALLTWKKPGIAADGDSTHYYAIYRAENGYVDPEQAEHLYDVVAVTDTFYWDFEYDETKDYYYAVTAFDLYDNESLPSNQVHVAPLGIDENENNIPFSFKLEQNFPNPFNPETNIRYSLPKTGMVHLEIFDISGKVIKVLVNEIQNQGIHILLWDGLDKYGRETASGIYFYRLTQSGFTAVKKMSLIK